MYQTFLLNDEHGIGRSYMGTIDWISAASRNNAFVRFAPRLNAKDGPRNCSISKRNQWIHS